MISFIIPAYNEELLLPGTIDAVRSAAESTGEPFEIIVVDDASTDHTAAIAVERGARLVSVQHRQIAATRNAGAGVAAGDKLIFVDADTRVTAAAVMGAARAMSSGAVGGGCAVRFDGKVPLHGRILIWLLLPLYRLAGLAAGCFLFCTREAFELAGRFDESLMAAEEVALSRALRRHGRFVVLREHVITSGRKVRTYSALEMLSLFARVAWRGRKAVEQREGLEIWYGERRTDPGPLA